MKLKFSKSIRNNGIALIFLLAIIVIFVSAWFGLGGVCFNDDACEEPEGCAISGSLLGNCIPVDYCNVDSDCVGDDCCCSQNVVNRNFGPTCVKVPCPAYCYGPLSGGMRGDIRCINNSCAITPQQSFCKEDLDCKENGTCIMSTGYWGHCDNFCKTKEDCVTVPCCSPTRAVNYHYAPDCSGAHCETEAEIECINKTCTLL